MDGEVGKSIPAKEKGMCKPLWKGLHKTQNESSRRTLYGSDT